MEHPVSFDKYAPFISVAIDKIDRINKVYKSVMDEWKNDHYSRSTLKGLDIQNILSNVLCAVESVSLKLKALDIFPFVEPEKYTVKFSYYQIIAVNTEAAIWYRKLSECLLETVNDFREELSDDAYRSLKEQKWNDSSRSLLERHIPSEFGKPCSQHSNYKPSEKSKKYPTFKERLDNAYDYLTKSEKYLIGSYIEYSRSSDCIHFSSSYMDGNIVREMDEFFGWLKKILDLCERIIHRCIFILKDNKVIVGECNLIDENEDTILEKYHDLFFGFAYKEGDRVYRKEEYSNGKKCLYIIEKVIEGTWGRSFGLKSCSSSSESIEIYCPAYEIMKVP
jgi:hypothetical protein